MMYHTGGNFLTSFLSLGVYLLQSYAIYRLAVVRGLPNAFFAFIPFLQLFMLGQLGDSLRYQSYQVDKLLGNVPLAYALPIISLVGSVLRYPLSLITALLVSAGTVLVYYLVFFCYARKNCVLFTVISCLSAFVTVLSILSLLPVVGRLFKMLSAVLSLALVIAPIAGPLLILYCLKDYKTYRRW